MKEVTIKKEELLNVLKNNRKLHRDIFEKAQAGYRQTVITKLDEALKDAKEGREIYTYFNLEAPIDQTSDYDRAILMLEMSIDDEITLSEREFSHYVLDNWSWKSQFITTNSLYLN